jgi:hypothetical protein
VVTLNESASSDALAARALLLLPRERLALELELGVALVAGALADALEDRVPLADPLRLGSHVLERDRLGRRERDLRAALEVDPEVQAADAEREHGDHEHGARDREPDPALADVVVTDPVRDLHAGRAHEARAVEPAEAGEEPEHRARREDGGDERHRRPDEQHQREAADAGGREREQDERGDRGHGVRVEDRREALRVAGRDRGPDRLPAA